MKTKLLFALSLLLCFITSAQRIDYALNHQEGLTHLYPYLVKATSTNQLLVAYTADDELNINRNYVSLVNPNGTIQQTTELFPSSNDEIIDMEETPMGVVIFSKSTIITQGRYLQQIDAKWLTGLNYTGHKVIYFSDSLVESVKFAYKNNNYVIFQNNGNGGDLVSGTINHQSKVITQNTYHFDTNQYVNPYRFDWVSGTNKNLFYINASSSIKLFEFDSAMQVINQKENTYAYGDLALFKNKLFNLSTTRKVGDSIFRSYLKDSLFRNIYTFKKGMVDNNTYNASLLFANSNFMYTLTDFEQEFGASTIDTILLTRFDSNLNTTTYEFTDFIATNMDGNEQGLVAVLGHKSTDLVLYVLDNNGLKTGVNELPALQQTTTHSYPNPVSNILNFSDIAYQAQVQLFNTQGQLVLNTNQTQNIDVSQLPVGLYFYKITHTQNQAVAQGKIIKQ